MFFFGKTGAKKNYAKFLSELRERRHAADDLMSEAEREKLDAFLADAAAASQEQYEVFRRNAVPLFRKYRRNWLGELLDLLLVVGAVAFGLRALFFQPFRIPTSSMQPTLYGIHFIDTEHACNPLYAKLPQPLRFLLFTGRTADLTLKNGGMLDVDSVRKGGNLLFDSTSFRVGNDSYTLPGDPNKVAEYSGLYADVEYPAGKVMTKGFLSLGDHLFVERLSLYFQEPRRGEVMVFTTEGLSAQGRKLSELSGFFYIKRLVGLPGDTLKISKDNVLWIRPRGAEKFVPVYELAPRTKKLYSDKGGYQGHLSGMGEFLSNPADELTVPEDCYFMMGDNSMFSLDSRFFGCVPRRNLVGRAWIVFWPFTRRWGLADRTEALDVPTGGSVRGTFPSMYLQ